MKIDYKLPKGYFDKLDFKIEIPTITCKICGEKILATPSNILNYE